MGSIEESRPVTGAAAGPCSGVYEPDPPDAGTPEPVEGTATGLQREAGRMPDGRRITYYWSRAAR